MDNHKAIIKGQVLRRRHFARTEYVGGYISEYKFITRRDYTDDFVEWRVLWEGNISSPLLEPGELFYIEDLELKVKISERMRTTSGNYIYETSHVLEVVEDETTRESYEQTDKVMRKYYEEIGYPTKTSEKLYEESLEYIRNQEGVKEGKSWFSRVFG